MSAVRASAAQIRRDIQLNRRVYGAGFVAGGELIAVIRYKRRRRALMASWLGVEPAYRKNGVARKMMEWLDDEARRCGVRRIRGSVRRSMAAELLPYYRSLGYRPRGLFRKKGYGWYVVLIEKRL